MKRLLPLIVTSLFMTSMAFATININTASESELETLNGIGPTRAKAIVDYRKQHGAFQSIEKIKNVPGIKEVIYVKIQGDIATSGINTPPVKSPASRARKAIHHSATKIKEKGASAVKSAADSVEKTAQSVKKKAANSEDEAKQ